jgi:transketolase
MSEGTEITIIACGSILQTAKAVAGNLEKMNISVSLISMPTVKPLDKEAVAQAVRQTKAIFTIEEHSEIGGLGSAVSEIICEFGKKVLFRKFAIADKYYRAIGGQKYILERNGLSEKKITEDIILKYRAIGGGEN